MPGWPTKEDSPVDEKAWEGRELREINFDGDRSLMLGQYKAYDFYGDGSFYLIDSPGHTVGHMCGLARTSADPPQFVFMVSFVGYYTIETFAYYTQQFCRVEMLLITRVNSDLANMFHYQRTLSRIH